MSRFPLVVSLINRDAVIKLHFLSHTHSACLSLCLQKYLQKLWDTVLLVALILSTGVIVQARWQNQDQQLNDNLEVNPSIN